MAFVHGKTCQVEVDAVDLSAFIDSATLAYGPEMADASTMGNASKAFIPGQITGTLSLAGKYDMTATTGVDSVLGPHSISGDVAAWTFSPEGGEAADVEYDGDGIVSSYQVAAPVGDIVAFTAEIQITGDITRTVLGA